MLRYEPYFSEETGGVQFEVSVGGNYVDAYVSQTLMAVYLGVKPETQNWVSVYLVLKEELDACVRRRAQDHGRCIIRDKWVGPLPRPACRVHGCRCNEVKSDGWRRAQPDSVQVFAEARQRDGFSCAPLPLR